MRYPHLANLLRSPEELRALERQGFVSAETCGNATVYKLRFRLRGKQTVRYLGLSSELASAISAELRELQAPSRTVRELNRTAKQVRAGLRASRRALAPILEDLGLHFHGSAIRQTRPSQHNKAVDSV